MNPNRKKNPASIQNIFCYTSDELKAYRDGKLAAGKRAKIAAHLNIEKCFRCRQIYQLISKSASEDSNSVSEEKVKGEAKSDMSVLKSHILE